jgi:hypothetical protein
MMSLANHAANPPQSELADFKMSQHGAPAADA